MVRLTAPSGAQAVPTDAWQPPRTSPARMEESRVSKVTLNRDTMTFQAKTTHRTPSSLSHAFSTPVVRELPSLPSTARSSAQLW
jgi:hypothetical protein